MENENFKFLIGTKVLRKTKYGGIYTHDVTNVQIIHSPTYFEDEELVGIKAKLKVQLDSRQWYDWDELYLHPKNMETAVKSIKFLHSLSKELTKTKR